MNITQKRGLLSLRNKYNVNSSEVYYIYIKKHFKNDFKDKTKI